MTTPGRGRRAGLVMRAGRYARGRLRPGWSPLLGEEPARNPLVTVKDRTGRGGRRTVTGKDSSGPYGTRSHGRCSAAGYGAGSAAHRQAEDTARCQVRQRSRTAAAIPSPPAATDPISRPASAWWERRG